MINPNANSFFLPVLPKNTTINCQYGASILRIVTKWHNGVLFSELRSIYNGNLIVRAHLAIAKSKTYEQ